MMSITPNLRPPKSGLERVRYELLTALHFGKLSPGDRAPSVRRLADLTGMNFTRIYPPGRPGMRDQRIDYCFLCPALAAQLRACRVDAAAEGSDHQPLWTELAA